ncbi:MAG TPA: S53 family peptidase [Marmoricola sp.]|nr:S53 family peptidase [Marmoricola sp.]
MSRKLRMTCAAVASAALAVGTLGLSPTATAAASGHQLPGSVPAWATASHKVAASKAATPVDFRVYLDLRGGDAAAKYALAASTPGSKAYGKFLTPQQFNARYAPSTSTVASVKSWLRSQGFRIGAVPANRKYVEAVGTVGKAARAFHTSFGQYKVQGQTLRANSRPLVIPGSLKSVQGVVGLDQSMALVHTDRTAQPPAGFRNAQPCSAFWGEKTTANTATPDGTALPASQYDTYAPCGYAGAQLQGAYGMTSAIKSGNDGTGVTVAIIDAYGSATMAQDLKTYSAKHGLPAPTGLYSEHVAPGTKIRGDNPQHSPSGWSGEEALDVEAVHTMAPGAHILYVGSPNNRQDMDAAMNWIVANDAADIVTNSYGFSTEAVPPGYIKPFNDILMQAAAEGISEFFSSGDNGDETGGSGNIDQATPDWAAVSPWVTAVGGTSMGVGAADNRIFELGWETNKYTLDKATTSWKLLGYLYGSGGGTSRIFAQPSYQSGVVPNDIATVNGDRSAPMRVVPDVAALGDPTTGMLVGQTQVFPDGTYYDEYRIGGTSLSSPLYAGMFALAVQNAGHRFGLANPALYSLAGTPAMHDITKAERATYPGAIRVDYANGVDPSAGYVYSVRTFDSDESLTIHVRPGYDDVTGLGSPNGQAWLDDLKAASQTP